MLQVGDMVKYKHKGPNDESLIGVVIKVNTQKRTAMVHWVAEQVKTVDLLNYFIKVS